jgi:hypothetical protein
MITINIGKSYNYKLDKPTLNQLVVGSIPTRPTNSIKMLRAYFR